MKFMIIRKADAETEAGVMPSQHLIEKMMAYNEELVKAGVMLAGEGLHPTSRGMKVHFVGGKPTFTDGPFTETKEIIAGFTIIQVKSREEAIEWVKKWPAEDGHGAAVLELRQIFDIEDFGDAATPELRETEARLRQETAGRQ